MKHALTLLAALLLAVEARCQAGDPPWYDDRKDLLWYQDEEGKLQPVKSEQHWGRRVAHIRANMELVMGRLPEKSNAVTAMAVFQGKLYAGTGKYRMAGSSLKESENLTLGGKVFRYEGGTRWTDCGQLPQTEAVGGMVGFRGQLYASSLYRPAGFFLYEGTRRPVVRQHASFGESLRVFRRAIGVTEVEVLAKLKPRE